MQWPTVNIYLANKWKLQLYDETKSYLLDFSTLKEIYHENRRYIPFVSDYELGVLIFHFITTHAVSLTVGTCMNSA